MQLADALVSALNAVEFAREVDVHRKWGARRELGEEQTRATIFPGSVARERADLATVAKTYDMSIVVQTRVSAASELQPEDDEDLTDEAEKIVDAIATAIEGHERLSVGDERVQLMTLDVSDHDLDDWHQRRIFTVLISATYERLVEA